MKQSRLLLAGVFVLLFLPLHSHTLAQAPDFDYERYPRLNFSVSHLHLDLEVDPDEPMLKGTASYRMTPNIPGVDTLAMRAAHMEITGVQAGGSKASFHLHNDTLYVALTSVTEKGSDFEVAISYETVPKFGFLKNANGTIWSSHLPLAQSHWYPVIDHPRITFSTSLSIQVPSGYQAIASGVKMEEEVTSLESVRFVYNSENDLPASALSLAIGRFESVETSFGVKKITLHHEQGMMNAESRQALLKSAYRQLQATEDELGIEYPFERLHIVVLDDHYGETKSWGSSTIYLYRNRGDLMNQLQRGIAAQWFGIYQREERWEDANAINLLQAALNYRMGKGSSPLEVRDTPFSNGTPTVYEAYGPQHWNRIQRRFAGIDSTFRTTIINTLREVVRWEGGVYSFRDYGEFWYSITGQPIFELTFSDTRSDRERTASDTTSYRVDYRFDEKESRLKLVFRALQGGFEDLVTLPMVHRHGNVSDTLEVTFTGSRDSVIVNVSPLVNNVEILEQEREELVLEEYKPAPFLLHTLRQDTGTSQKVEAAKRLGAIRDNPDLQLAIQDLLSRDPQPEVRAALLSSLAKITRGAKGTEQVFLDALESDNRNVQRAALQSLANYGQSESVQQAVRRYVSGIDSLSLFGDALQVFSAIADSAAFQEFVNQTVQTDTAGYKAIEAIGVLTQQGNTERALRQAEYYLSDVYDYPIRARALHLMFEYPEMAGSWEGRVRRLLNDLDPRIRYLVARGLQRNPGLVDSEMVGTLMMDEYDQRVYRAMENFSLES